MKPSTPEDASPDLDLTPSLIVRLRAGEAGAGELLDRLHRDAMLRFCRGYLGNAADAQDAVQEVFYLVLRAPTVPERFRPWLYKIARNHCLKVLRTRQRKPAPDALPEASALLEDATGQLTGLLQNEVRGRLRELVASLPEAQAEVLRLRYGENLSREEIADVLDLPESVVKSRLFEAVKRLRSHTSLFGSEG